MHEYTKYSEVGISYPCRLQKSMDRRGRKLRHSQAPSPTAGLGPQVGGDGGGVHFHSLKVMVTGPEKWGNKGGRESMLLSSSFTLSLSGCEHAAMKL